MNVRIIKHNGGIYTLYSKKKLNTTLEKAWEFFSQPKNLNSLTPPELDFKINSGNSKEFYEGKIITYSISLLSFLKFNWTTEITKVKEKEYFIDKQIFGPYKLWHHEHHFQENEDGSLTIIDKVKYKLYLHPFSKIIHKIFIKRKLLKIFNFRNKMMSKIFY